MDCISCWDEEKKINTVLADMPCSIHGYVLPNVDDTYTVVINSRLNMESQIRTYAHELQHICHGDLYSETSADTIEMTANKNCPGAGNTKGNEE